MPTPPADDPRPSRARRLIELWPLALLALPPCVLVFAKAGSDFTLWGSDMITGGYHIRGMLARQVGEGRLPVWDPHTMCGFPVLAAMQAGILYPLSWLVAPLSPGPSYTVSVLIHLILAGWLAYGWLKRGLGLGTGAALTGATVYMLSGYLLTRVMGGHIAQISSYPWMAAVLWGTESMLAGPTLRRGVLLAASVALLMLPGFPQFVFFTGLMVSVRLVAYGIRTRKAGIGTLLRTSLAGAAGLLFCAPQLFVTLEALPEVQRVAGVSYPFATQLSVPWHNLLCLIAPSLFGDDARTLYWSRGAIWEATGFVGISGLVLGAVALTGRHPQRWFWAAAAGIAVLLCLGNEAPFFKVFYYAVPGAGLFRGPGRYLAVFTVALSALAALGFDRLWREEPENRRTARTVAVGAAVLLASILVALALWTRADASPSGSWHRFVSGRLSDPEWLALESLRTDPGFPERARLDARDALGRAAVTLGIIAACLLPYAVGRMRGRTCAVALGVIVGVELVSFGIGFFRPHEARRIGWPQDFVDFLKNAPERPFRLASPGHKRLAHIGKCELAGLDHVAGYESMTLRGYCELLNVVHGRPPDLVRTVSTVDVAHPLLDMLGVKYWLLAEGQPSPPQWRALGKVSDGTDDSIVFESPGAFPRAFIVPEAIKISSREERLRFLLNPATDLRKVVVLESDFALPSGAGGAGPATAGIRSFAPGEYDLSTESAGGGFLVLTEAYFPGWEARIDGVPTELLRANHFVQAVRLPPGRHTVRFEYHSRRLRPGFLVSAVLLLATLGFARWRRRRPTSPAAQQ